MLNRLIELTVCRNVRVIFESSERADRLVEQAFQSIYFHRGWKHIPSECYFMLKSAGEPGLEVADFVMHAVGRQTRHNLKVSNRKFLERDFSAIFEAVDPKLVSLYEIESAIRQSTD